VSAEQVERRLAAILAADFAGYSRLMGADEEGTLERLKAHRRELIDPEIAEHHRRIVKTTGDGMLVEFGSVVDAVRCDMRSKAGTAGAGELRSIGSSGGFGSNVIQRPVSIISLDGRTVSRLSGPLFSRSPTEGENTMGGRD
jgi:hypothetical protein